jgi:hypothetical protein
MPAKAGNVWEYLGSCSGYCEIPIVGGELTLFPVPLYQKSPLQFSDKPQHFSENSLQRESPNTPLAFSSRPDLGTDALPHDGGAPVTDAAVKTPGLEGLTDHSTWRTERRTSRMPPRGVKGLSQ